MRLLIALTAAGVLTACSAGPATEAWNRSDVVKTCANGTTIALDPQTHRYVTRRFDSWSDGWVSFLAPGVDPSTVCAEK